MPVEFTLAFGCLQHHPASLWICGVSFYIVILLCTYQCSYSSIPSARVRYPFGIRKHFSKKYTHAGRIVNTTLPACFIYHFSLRNLQSAAQKHQNAEDFCSIIIEILKQYYPTFLIHKTKHPQRNRILIHILCVIFHYISLVCR